MIRVSITRTTENKVQSFSISGHANFANRGQDIVCAGVSAVSIGSINAVMSLTDADLDIKQADSGYISVNVPDFTDAEIDSKVQLLLEGMIVSLQTIEKDYGKYITISEQVGGAT
ncbi:ribosomal-processing cysteine protease Prp [Bacillus sp. HMF5848]|uniref:ribosomal-processing cysteine protease Prp n=1 Tax=Bacillus sp. HMF5848 TaxID=2495421 RepID=UPI000F77525E|nr:ribosomal-processing cysteine protease Prp [Bacillus sp. HMF5848]RSK28007.1 ribosomal-processing cysteine protease Prp [Bacillus sp. HMF5848]